MSSLTEVLARIERTATGGRLPVAVFDLDSTLFDTAARNLRILQEFARAQADRWTWLPETVATVTLDELGWDVGGPLRHRGHAQPALHEALQGFWMERFFTDAYVVHDHAAPGGPTFVHACHDRGALVYYLTGRHRDGMGAGTVRALTARGYPYWRGRCVLHLKPRFDMPDKEFKAQALADIRSHRGDVVATFDNEPGNANQFAAAFPDALNFLYGRVRSPTAEDPAPALVELHTFRA